jgi:type IV pilus assembly protein PilM
MKLASLLKDPPPTHAFELSEEGIAFALIAEPARTEFAQLEAGALTASPAHDNIQQPHAVLDRIHSLVPPNGHRKRRAALILPDYCARIAVLDFDAFPSQPHEQLALLRFRLKKSVPFDVDSAIVNHVVQARGPGQKVEILAAVIAADIVAEYETPFRAAGFHPGFVTISSLAALNLMDSDGVSLLVKLSGRVLSVLVLDGAVVKLSRCIEMDAGGAEEIDSVLHPTIAYIEDELKTRPSRIWLGGLAADFADLADRCQTSWGMAVEPLRSRFGAPGRTNAGLLGYLESVSG